MNNSLCILPPVSWTAQGSASKCCLPALCVRVVLAEASLTFISGRYWYKLDWDTNSFPRVRVAKVFYFY